MSTTQAPGRHRASELSGVAWHISSRSDNGGGSCVEAGAVRDDTGRVALRHSHHPNAHAYVYSHTAWTGFTASIKAGSYDFA